MPFIGLLLMTCSACFLMPPRLTCPGMALPLVCWVLQHQSLTKKRPFWWRHFLHWSPSSQITSLCQVDKQLTGHQLSHNLCGEAWELTSAESHVSAPWKLTWEQQQDTLEHSLPWAVVFGVLCEERVELPLKVLTGNVAVPWRCGS